MKATSGNRPTGMRRAWLPAVAGLMLAFAAGCQSAADKPDNDAMAAEQQIKTVKVAQVTKQIISEPEEVVANVVPSVQMDIILKADGDVRELVKKRGDTVAKDEVILRIDDKDARSQKEKADLAVRNAEIQLKKTREDIENGRAEMKSAMDKLQRQLDDMQRQYNKLLNDYDAGLVNKQQLEQAELNLANMKQDLDVLKMKYDALLNSDAVEAAELALQTARLNAEDAAKALGYYDVKAPVGGVLTELVPEVGMTVGRGFRAGQIVQLDPVKIQAGLTAAQRAKVEGKSELAFRISGSTEWMTGKIRYLADVVNSQTNAYDLELEVPNKDTLLKPGMKVQVRLTSEQEQQVVAVPMTSIVREGMETYVFVLNNDIAEKRKVELGRLKDTYQEVLSGLKEGETLIVSGHQQLNDKEKVQVAR